MIVAGTHRSPWTPEATLDTLRDLPEVCRRLPIAEVIDEREDGVRAIVRPETSLGVTTFIVDARVESSSPAALRYQLMGRRGEGAMNLKLDIEVTPEGAGALVSWRADADFYGVFAAVGQRALPAIARDQLEALFEAITTSSLTTRG
jgi:carbon monoxide dehydrogenase subunit G